MGSDSVIGGRHVVQKLEFDPKYHVRFSNPKLISLFDEAISGRVSTLSNELVNELNNILIKESSKSIMTDWPNVRHNNHVKKWDVHSIDKKGCYVATAVYGSYDCPEVWTLRRYRDYYLAETRRGRAFIRAYYVISPTIVKWFGQTDWFKKMWKGKLDRMVKKLQRNGVESTPYDDPKW